ncbi:hypothetical protein [Flavobacterium sp. LC2016-01]|uniref:hypothetical protein n=1 Tax=Flavobacterium sp. LC2016-01 TaxID=2675876 RepID=UPI0012BB0B69|nr:hypothetical protein [Flavobacterium sp. LC2016-01]MTH16869.1 hypothetical protein [Flavobacterium sp. LC2016-01]
MKKKYSIIIFSFLCYGTVIAQSAHEKTTAIQANFTEKSIEAYQQNSMDKVSELYQYLTLYSDKNSNAELKKQLMENITSLFIEENTKIYDFLSPEKKIINLSLLLNKIENKSYEFKLKPSYNSTDLSFNSWTNQYGIEVTNGISQFNFTVNQKIYFSPNEKTFGVKNKTVWDIKLGDILP